MKSVVVLYNKIYPNSSPGSKRLELYIKGLEESGVDVFMISTGRKGKSFLGGIIYLYISPYIAFYRVIMQKNDAKLLFVYGFGWIGLTLIRIATVIKGQKMVIEMNEMPASCEGNRITNIETVRLFTLFMYQKLVISWVDGLIVISDQLREYVTLTTNRKKNVLVVPILVDPYIQFPTNEKKICEHRFLFHSGALSERKDGISEVFQAFAYVSQRLSGEIEFFYTDRMAYKEQLDKIDAIIRTNNLENQVHFVGHLSEDKLIKFQQQCSMLILNKPDNEQNRFNFPTKLGEYLRFSKPVIFTPVGAMTNYLKDNENAFQVPVSNPQFLAKKILYILNNEVEVREIAKKGRLLVENDFNYRLQSSRIKLFFDNIVGC